ncbi:hypothetical protein HY251_18875, partial [bacterium]|nr:hypothetical protein [bacterium]
MSHCPDLSRLRALAEEDERDETLLLHVKSCARCTRLVDLARREERAIRGALPVEPPRDLLEKTLRALDAEAPRAKRPDSGRRRARSLERPRPIFALLLAAAVVLAALCLGYQLVVSEPAPPPEEATAPPDATKPPKPTETPAAPPK